MAKTFTKIRRRSVKADTENICVTVDIAVGIRGPELTRDEHNALLDEVTSRVMREIPLCSYIDISLSRIRVTR